jgi:hypothetical protein
VLLDYSQGLDSCRWASRMICGFCSLEQPLGERCSGCGKRLASNAHKCAAGLSLAGLSLEDLLQGETP